MHFREKDDIRHVGPVGIDFLFDTHRVVVGTRITLDREPDGITINYVRYYVIVPAAHGWTGGRIRVDVLSDRTRRRRHANGFFRFFLFFLYLRRSR